MTATVIYVLEYWEGRYSDEYGMAGEIRFASKEAVEKFIKKLPDGISSSYYTEYAYTDAPDPSKVLYRDR